MSSHSDTPPHAANPARADGDRPVSELAVSLTFLIDFYEKHVQAEDEHRIGAGSAARTTKEVIEEVVKPLTASSDGRGCRYVNLLGFNAPQLWGGPSSGDDMRFVSHAWNNPFHLLVDSLRAHLTAAGAALDRAFVWLDLFALNQHAPGQELGGGEALEVPIRLSVESLVVVDSGGTTFTRLWCLFEMFSMPTEKMCLLRHGMTPQQLAGAVKRIDSANAKCDVLSDKPTIVNRIREKHGSLPAADRALRLRFLLLPLSYEGDVEALLSRSTDERNLTGLWEEAESTAAGSALFCVYAESGEGKSTISAALAKFSPSDKADPWVDAVHFCKASDRRRQDPVLVAKSLSYQLGLRFPEVAQAVLALDAAEVATLQKAEEALQKLVLGPLMARPSSARRPVLLFDALDEADPPGAKTALSNPVLRVVTSLHAVGALVLVTTRPEPPHIVWALQGRWQGAYAKREPGMFLRATAGTEGIPPSWVAAIKAHERSKVLCTVLLELAKKVPDLQPPSSLSAAYEAAFSLARPSNETAAKKLESLLQVLVAAREPLSMAALQAWGTSREDLARLPLWGVLFQERDFHVHQLHKSLTEWLRGESRPTGAPFVVDVVAGERLWADHCAGAEGSLLALEQRDPAATPNAYALRYALQHLTAAGEWARLGVVLLDYDFWEHAFRAGFTLIDDVAAARDCAAEAARRGTAKAGDCEQTAGDVLRWLLAEGHFMRQDPPAVLQRAVAAPTTSAVSRAAKDFYRKPALELVNPPLEWPSDILTVPLKATVKSACFSPDGLMLLAAAGTVVHILYAASGQARERLSHRKMMNVLLASLVAALEGHLQDVTCCVWSADGSLIATASNSTLKLWDAATGQEKCTLSGHSSDVNACAFSRDGQTVLSGSNDRTLKLWDVGTGAEKYTLRGHSGAVLACAFSKNGQTVLSGSGDKTLKLWDVGTGKEKYTLSGQFDFEKNFISEVLAELSVEARSFWMDEKVFIYNGQEYHKTVQEGKHIVLLRGKAVWRDLCKYTLSGHSASVNACAFGPDGSQIVSAAGQWGWGQSDNTLKLWDVGTGKEKCTLSGHLDFEKNFFKGDLVGGFDSWENEKTFDYQGQEYRKTIVDGRHIVYHKNSVVDGRHVVHLVGEVVWRDLCKYTLSGHSCWVSSCAFSPDGQTVLSGSGDNTLKLWDVGTGKAKYILRGHSDYVKCCAFSKDGQTVLSGSWDYTLKLWDVGTGKEKYTLSGHSNNVNSCAFSKDGQTVLSGSSDKTLKLWDVGTGKAKYTLRGHSGAVLACAFSPKTATDPGGQSILSASSDSTLKLWDVGSGVEKYTLSGHSDNVYSCAFSKDGQTVLSGSSDKTLKLWDVGTGKAKYTLSGQFDFEKNFFTTLYIGGPFHAWEDEKVFTYSDQEYRKTVQEGKHVVLLGREVVWRDLCKYTLSGHLEAVRSCAFSPDGQTVLSGSKDRTLKLWDVGTGAEKYTLSGHLDFERNFFEINPMHLGGGFCQWQNEKTFKYQVQEYRKTVVDGRHIVYLGDEVVWRDLCKYTLSGHSSNVNACAFSPDGQTVLSGRDDTTLKLWDVGTGKEKYTLSGHSGPVLSCRWASNDTIVSSSSDGTTRWWRRNPQSSGEFVAVAVFFSGSPVGALDCTRQELLDSAVSVTSSEFVVVGNGQGAVMIVKVNM